MVGVLTEAGGSPRLWIGGWLGFCGGCGFVLVFCVVFDDVEGVGFFFFCVQYWFDQCF